MVKGLPEPSATYLTYVNDRNVKALGPILVPHLGMQADPAASPERAASVPAAPVFLLHGDEERSSRRQSRSFSAITCAPRGWRCDVLLSQIITHAELDRSAAVAESWKLVSFWADILRH